MKRLVKYLSVSSLLAFCALLAFGKVGTIYQGATGAAGLITEAMQLLSSGNTTWDVAVGRHGYAPSKPSTDVTLFLNANNQWVSPISQYGLTSGRIPMAFTSGAQTFVDSAMSQDFTGNITFNSSHDVTFTQATANRGAYFDGSKRLKPFTFGTGLSFDTGTATLSATLSGGNVTATPTTGAGGSIAVFDNDTGTDIAKSAGLTWDGTTLGTGGLNINVNHITATDANIGGQTFPGGSSGTFTPVLTRIAGSFDESGSVTYRCFYTRVGNIVHCAGRITFSITVPGTACEAEITLPIGSNLAAIEDLAGVGNRMSPVNTQSNELGIYAGIANDKAHIKWVSGSAGLVDYGFQFDYIVL